MHDKGQPIRDAAGAIRWLYGTISDITDVKRLEQERERIALEQRVAQRLESVGQLAAGVAHEINTPMQFVSDSVHFLRDGVRRSARLVDAHRARCADAVDRGDAAALDARSRTPRSDADLDYLLERIPAALRPHARGLRAGPDDRRRDEGLRAPRQDDASHVDLNAR